MAEVDFSEQLAQIAYTAYGKTTNFKNYQGSPMPSWDSLPSSIKSAWMQAAGAVKSADVSIPKFTDVSCRCYWTVEVGVVPEIPIPELTKQFGMTTGEYESERNAEIFHKRMVEAIEYAR